jgi:non-specific serine/threonine protein kinase
VADRAEDAPGPRLPTQRSSFVGRRAELSEVRRLLAEFPVVTLVGPGGVGKTRLAVRAVDDLRRAFPDGQAFADLAAVQDSTLVARQVAEALDLRDSTGGWLPDGLVTRVGDRHLLLVLDNCEHVRDAAAVLADALIGSCPRLRILATSRQPLDLAGEAVLAVPPLASPTPTAGPEALGYDAVRLLLDRARAAVPELHLGEADVPELSELCRRLDGLPLAIELAAVRLRTFTAADVVARLDDRFALLTRTGTAGPQRHRTLRATLEWSLDLLPPAQQLLWQRAAVFASAFDLPAAEVVCGHGGLPVSEILDALTGLVEASVLQVIREPGTTRFRMLETVRAFGEGLLERSGEQQLTQLRHREWCAQLAARAARDYASVQQVAAFNRLAAVHAELSAALRFCLQTPGEEARGLELACDLWLYWEARGHVGEGMRLVHDLLRACPEPSGLRARGLTVAGFLALGATDTDTATRLLREALTLAKACGDPFVVAMATQYLGQAALFRGELRDAEELLRGAAALFESIDRRHSAFCLADAGLAALFADDHQTAAVAFGESLELNEGGDPWTRSHALWGLGLVLLRAGDPCGCTGRQREALRLIQEVDHRTGIAVCIDALAWAAAARRDWDEAAMLAGAAQAVWRSLPDLPPPPPLAALRDEYLRPARAALPQRQWHERFDSGSRLTRAEAVAAALGTPRTTSGPRPAEPTTSVLTRRQQEVAALVAQGLTDREIAARLVISPRTAESHVEQILTRLGLRSRAEIAAWTAARRPSPT